MTINARVLAGRPTPRVRLSDPASAMHAAAWLAANVLPGLLADPSSEWIGCVAGLMAEGATPSGLGGLDKGNEHAEPDWQKPRAEVSLEITHGTHLLSPLHLCPKHSKGSEELTAGFLEDGIMQFTYAPHYMLLLPLPRIMLPMRGVGVPVLWGARVLFNDPARHMGDLYRTAYDA